MTASLERPLEVPDPPARGSSVRRSAATVLCAVLALTAAACTSSDPEAEPPAADASSGAADPFTTPEPVPVTPAKVRVTRVSGQLKEKDRQVLADNVKKVVTAYFDDAFVGGDYPRESFGDAFATFSSGAAQQADGDRDLLTNRVLGPTIEAVEVRRRTAYLSVLAPYKVAAGITANIDLDLLVERSAGPPERVRVNGRLLLTRDRDGGWTIFGYDVSRSDTPARSGS